MKRIYKAFRFAYETKYWIDCLITFYDEKLQRNIENGFLEQFENDIYNRYENALEGVTFSYTFHTTTGGIIEEAVKKTKSLTIKEWKELAKEADIQKNRIEYNDLKDATPSVYLSQSTFDELERLQNKLREDNPRVPKKAYIIKLAVFYLYKNTFC